MTWWEITIPTLTAEQQHGVQVFTYPETAFRVSAEARQRASVDAISADAIRHRRGAQVDLARITVSSRHSD
jgi:hypothetical protein